VRTVASPLFLILHLLNQGTWILLGYLEPLSHQVQTFISIFQILGKEEVVIQLGKIKFLFVDFYYNIAKGNSNQTYLLLTNFL